MAKKTKPKLGAQFAQRTEKIEVRFGFVNALEFTYTDEELETILKAYEQYDDGWDGKGDEHYLVIDEAKNIVVCLVRTHPEPEDGKEDPNGAYISEAVEKAQTKQKIPLELQQTVVWSCKCKAAPNNLLSLRLSEDQAAQIEADTAYLFIGPLQIQWSKKVKTSEEGVLPETFKYVNSNEAKEGYYEKHTLSLSDWIGS